ncbi:hypothetical protein Q6272_32000, partial [Klebsiella pneumoniae]|nr:hypothetical protein [Klebsiella pneumoniae]
VGGDEVRDQVLLLARFLGVLLEHALELVIAAELRTEIRNDPRLRGLYVVLHTSLSGSFNDSMVKKVGCDNFLSKFQPDKLV